MEIEDYPIPRVYCGAKTRSAGRCHQPAMPNGKCRLHGGKSLAGKAHGRYRTGMFTREALAIRRESRQLVKFARAMLADI
ncbi:hypothetical protein Gbem_4138 [Citrifermentans bemidjiense Bem]|uniref:Uncharacterized protein n=2 Tax=Citrifermentans bemidjiense TaxID=225194 RepID=E1P6E3_CITBB|nr:hypothetical protein Gbem_4138 [Citrifermentans bemidjiense Bem]